MMTLNDTEWMDIYGIPYPQVVSFEEIRGIFIDELHHDFSMEKDSGLFTPRSEKKYYQGRRDAMQDIFMKIKKNVGRISEPQYRPRTWRGISDDKRFTFCANCHADLTNYDWGIKYCPECGRCFMTPEERERHGLAPEHKNA